MSLAWSVALFAVATLAGAINAVAGGGSLLTFPLLLATGMPPVVANATNAVALAPGSLASAVAYRRELAELRRTLLAFAPVAAVGGFLGGVVLVRSKPEIFDAIVPWLVIGATALLFLQDGLAKQKLPPAPLAVCLGAQLLVSFYGGYFGAGMGIMMLAVLGLLGIPGWNERNAIKTALAAIINGVASGFFLAAGAVDLRAAAILTAGALFGGFFGAKVARRVPAPVLRRVVIAIGVLLGLALLAKRLSLFAGA